MWRLLSIAGRTVTLLLIACVCGVFCLPFFVSHMARFEFQGLAGEKAESRIRSLLGVEGINLRNLQNASVKSCGEIDRHVGWYQLALPSDIAEELEGAIHARLEKYHRDLMGDEIIEGVHRMVAKPVLPEISFAKAPEWWSPPSLVFRVSERMVWSQSATYANAMASGFDPATNLLWIFDYGEQHSQLWPKGSVPMGDQFFSSSQKN